MRTVAVTTAGLNLMDGLNGFDEHARLSITKLLLAYTLDGFRLIHATRRSTRELHDIQLPIRLKFSTTV